ncbi:ATP-binding protein [Halomonas halocynthiae]|uniref:ATP-binding protein n=1 Tax=Halomonas halocynthiae TaxID=176290 RepID=UPI000405A809|nr:ATP-binding protein [Halomonas halocynthiae]
MAHLLRIVMIHGHLDGVVELSLDGHTNICGTNASGKTTLQRLVPVFYGELPNRVVPRTRMKFDAFYLPNSNSYLVYEYRREAGSLCQVVLTRSTSGGVEYRFVAAPYRPEDYLLESEGSVVARDYPQWLNGLRHNGIATSSKLTATSEYRAVIQNDFTPIPGMASHGNRKEALRLRQMAAQFSLVKPEHRIRHMEKLVSAVHAKEGKLDTLKTMLAAIFEEDGVELPVTRIRSTKARDWIAQMRQSMRLTPLQRALAELRETDAELARLDAVLWQLKPQLDADQHRTERTAADTDAAIKEQKALFKAQQEDYETARDALNDQLSAQESERKQAERSLEDLQQRYEAYEDADMPQLERDLQALPQQREKHQQLREHLALMQEAAEASQARKDARLRELGETLARQSEELQAQMDAVGEEQAARRETHWDDQQRLINRYQQQRQTLDASFQGRVAEGVERLATLKAALVHQGPNADETAEAELAQARLDQAQSTLSAARDHHNSLRLELEAHKQERENADSAFNAARQRLEAAQQHSGELYRQKDPEQGSLRHFLRFHRPGWEQSLGKVLAPELLERRDLAPAMLAVENDDSAPENDSLYGLQVNLNAIALPDYAQDEASLLAAIEAADAAVLRAEADVESNEKNLRRQVERVTLAEQALGKARLAITSAEEDVEYAQQARRQLQERHARAQQQRRAEQEKALAEQQAIQQALQEEQQDAQAKLEVSHQAELLELKADAQSQLDSLAARFQQHKQQLTELKSEHQRQCKELEQAFDQELQASGVDPVTLRDTRHRLQQLETHIRATAARQEELDLYQRFMRVEWGQQKPELIQQLSELTRSCDALKRQRDQQQQAFKSTQASHRQALNQLQEAYQQAQALLEELKPLLKQLDELALSADASPQQEAPGDVSERLARARQALKQRAEAREHLRKGCQDVESQLIKGASSGFVEMLEGEREKLPDRDDPRRLLPLLGDMLKLLEDQQQQLVQQGRNIGDDLVKFFTVFRDLNRRISAQSRRLSDEVADDLRLEGITKAEVQIQSTIDELGFWEPLKDFAQRYHEWTQSGYDLPSDDYLNALTEVVDLLRHDQQYSFESLLRLELHLNEGGADLVIKNDRQLLESSSHGMAYLILCKFLLAFTRLLRGKAEIAIHWPIDEIGTLAYHNVEKLFDACDSNRIHVVGAFPNPESDVLMLFHHRYLIEQDAKLPDIRRLKRIEPRLSPLAARIKARSEEVPA